jgi:hypothetical protein
MQCQGRLDALGSHLMPTSRASRLMCSPALHSMKLQSWAYAWVMVLTCTHKHTRH